MTRPAVLAVIPARGGSKGIVHKNICPVAGKPLISWTVEAALQSKYIDKIVVSSDDAKTLRKASDFPVCTLERPAELSGDCTPSEPVVMHALLEMEKQGERFDYVVLLQPTSPARSSTHIDAAFSQMLSDQRACSMISVSQLDHSPFKAFVINEEGELNGIIDNEMPFMPRQSLPDAYLPNGAIYIVKANLFKRQKVLFIPPCVPFQMDKKHSIDIDTQADIELFEYLMESESEGN